MDKTRHLTNRLKYKFKYLKMLEPFTTTQMYVDSWIQALDELEDGDIVARDLMHELPARRKRPLAKALIGQIEECLKKAEPYSRLWSKLEIKEDVLRTFLNSE
jgi:hypothetical protein